METGITKGKGIDNFVSGYSPGKVEEEKENWQVCWKNTNEFKAIHSQKTFCERQMRFCHLGRFSKIQHQKEALMRNCKKILNVDFSQRFNWDSLTHIKKLYP